MRENERSDWAHILIKDGDEGRRRHGKSFKMIGDKRKISKTHRDEDRSSEIDPKDLR